MPSKTLQWIAIVALFAAFWVEWVRSSFGVRLGWWADAFLATAMAFNIVLQVAVIRFVRKNAVK